MDTFVKTVEKRMRELQTASSRKCTAAVERARAYHEGYLQGTEDLLKAMEEVAEDETLYKEKKHE